MSSTPIVGFHFFIIVHFSPPVIRDISIILYGSLNMDVLFDLLANSFGFEPEMGLDLALNYSVILL